MNKTLIALMMISSSAMAQENKYGNQDSTFLGGSIVHTMEYHDVSKDCPETQVDWSNPWNNTCKGTLPQSQDKALVKLGGTVDYASFYCNAGQWQTVSQTCVVHYQSN